MADPSIGAASTPTIVVVGAAARDIDAADPRGWRLGGGVSFASMAAARLGARVRALIGVDELAADSDEIRAIAAAGADVRLVSLAHGPVFDNRETEHGRVQVIHELSDPIPVEALPEEWAADGTLTLTPVAGELGAEWADAVSRDTFVALAWQGLLRKLEPGEEVSRLPLSSSALVARADAIALSAEDAHSGGPPIRELLHDGQRLLLTHGGFGSAELWLDEGHLNGRTMPPLPSREPLDTTGAGDIFFAAWLVTRSLAAASAMASLSLMSRSLVEMPTRRDLCEVLVRLRDQSRR